MDCGFKDTKQEPEEYYIFAISKNQKYILNFFLMSTSLKKFKLDVSRNVEMLTRIS